MSAAGKPKFTMEPVDYDGPNFFKNGKQIEPEELVVELNMLDAENEKMKVKHTEARELIRTHRKYGRKMVPLFLLDVILIESN